MTTDPKPSPPSPRLPPAASLLLLLLGTLPVAALPLPGVLLQDPVGTAVRAGGPSPGEPAAPAGAETATLRGRVVDVHGQPVVDGEAVLSHPHRRTALSADGRFAFERLAPGEYLVEVRSELHGSGVRRVELAAGETEEVEITLDLSTFSDTMVVSVGADPKSRLEVAQPVSVLSGEDLDLRLQPTLGETLEAEPGVGSTYFGPGASRPVIRGLAGDRVRVLEGGVGSLDVSATSPDHAVGYDPLIARSIEVVRGPATLLYGSSAVGGVVNVLDDRVPSYVPERPVSGEVSLLAGTGSEQVAGAFDLVGGGGSFAWHAHGSRWDTDDHEIPDGALPEGEAPEGVLPNSALERESAGLGASWVGERGYLGVAVSGFDSLYGVPGGHGPGEEGAGEETEGEEGPVRIDLEQRRLDLDGELFSGRGLLQGVKLRLGLADYRHRELEGDEVGTRFDSQGLEGRLELVQRRRGDLSGSFGLQLSDVDLEAVGEEAFVPPSRTRSLALFAFEELRLGEPGSAPVTLQLGARVEGQDTDPEPPGLPSRSFGGVSGSLGALWRVTPAYSLTASLARTERLPTAGELYADGPHAATRTFELGNPGLTEETSLGLDLSLRRREGRVTGVVNLFVNRFDDFIFERFTGDLEDGLEVVRFVQEDAEFLGAEVDATVALFQGRDRHLDLLLQADWVEAELRSTGEPLPRIPPLSWRLGLNAHQGRFRGTVEVEGTGRQDDVAVGETPTAGHTLLHASASYRLFVGGTVVDLHLRGRNLTDRVARVHSSFLKREAPLPGRDLTLSLRFKF